MYYYHIFYILFLKAFSKSELFNFCFQVKIAHFMVPLFLDIGHVKIIVSSFLSCFKNLTN
jgi:hypothetical protein